MKIVIAGNYRQYLFYLIESNESEETARFVESEEDLQDVDDAEVVFYGTSWLNPVADSPKVRALLEGKKG